MRPYQADALSDLLCVARKGPFPVLRAAARWAPPPPPGGAKDASESIMAANLFAGINEPSDPRNLSDLEKRHTPVIRAPDIVCAEVPFELEVEVGSALPHSSDPGHFIQFIELYADELFLARLDLAAGRAAPRLVAYVMLRRPAREILAYADCNLHGVWVGRRAIAFRD
jgi:superoxide reductase